MNHNHMLLNSSNKLAEDAPLISVGKPVVKSHPFEKDKPENDNPVIDQIPGQEMNSFLIESHNVEFNSSINVLQSKEQSHRSNEDLFKINFIDVDVQNETIENVLSSY